MDNLVCNNLQVPRRSKPIHTWFFLAALSLVCLVCSDGRPVRVPISGIVTIDGEPVKFGSILFSPQDGTRPGGGAIEGEEGRFRVSTYTAFDGLPPGKYDVTVSAIEVLGEYSQRWHAPKRYADVATAAYSVTIGGESDSMHIELTWEGDKHSKPFIEKFD